MLEDHLAYRLLEDLPETDRIMIDVGAHWGGFLRKFADSGWNVHAFEPDPQNRKKLVERTKQFNNCSIYSEAVSETVQTDVVFYNSKVSTGISGLHKFHDSHRECGKIDTITLRKFCEDKGIKTVGLLKIDTEGHDLFVLKGFPWEKLKPRLIVVEFEDRKTIPLGYSFHDIASYLRNQEYSLLVSEWYPIVEYGRKHKWRRFTTYPCELVDTNAWGNIFAFRNEMDTNKILNAISTILSKQQIMLENRNRTIEYLKESLGTRLMGILNRIRGRK